MSFRCRRGVPGLADLAGRTSRSNLSIQHASRHSEDWLLTGSVVVVSLSNAMNQMARWRSGNAAVCKTVMRGFDPLPRLQHIESVAMLLFTGLADPEVACTSV